MTKKWLIKAKDYKAIADRFIKKGFVLDFSEQALQKAYEFETFGKGKVDDNIFQQKTINGYLFGKQWLNWHITEWKKAIEKGLLLRSELEEDFGKGFVDRNLT